MSTFILAISCLTLPICLDSWTWYSRFLCNIALYSIRLFFHHHSYPQFGVVFALAPSLQSFWSYFSTDLQQHIGHLLTWGVPLSVSYHFAFSYCSSGSQGKNTEVVCHSLLQGTPFCQNSPLWPVYLGWPYMAWLSFIELDKAVIGLASLIFCDCGFHSLCPVIDEDKRLTEPSWWDHWLWGKSNLALVRGRAQ